MARWFNVALLSSCLAAVSVPAMAQHDALMETYGQAVHKYFAGDVAGSEMLLQDLITNGSEDPRVHYFLGLCRVKQGGIAAGAADFENGAMAEAKTRKSVEVGRALQRIQGAVRVEIEKARLTARKTVGLQQALEQRARMDTLPVAPAPTPSGTPADPVETPAETVVEPVQPSPPDTTNPFGDEAPAAGTENAPAESETPADIFSTPAGDDANPF